MKKIEDIKILPSGPHKLCVASPIHEEEKVVDLHFSPVIGWAQDYFSDKSMCVIPMTPLSDLMIGKTGDLEDSNNTNYAGDSIVYDMLSGRWESDFGQGVGREELIAYFQEEADRAEARRLKELEKAPPNL